jgi:hypothetical protein
VVAVGDRGHPPTLKPPNIQCQPINVTMLFRLFTPVGKKPRAAI